MAGHCETPIAFRVSVGLGRCHILSPGSGLAQRSIVPGGGRSLASIRRAASEEHGMSTSKPYWRRVSVVVGMILSCQAESRTAKQRTMDNGKPNLSVTMDTYGRLPDGRVADLFTLTNATGMRVRLTNYGA